MLLSQLEYFRVIAQYEHMSKAAEVLCVSQPALSATVSKLEKRLGVPLFERQGRNITLNEAGKSLLNSADFIQEQLAEMNRALQMEAELSENKLSLAVHNDIFLYGWLQEFVTQYPKIRLQQRLQNEPQMIEALLAETIDIALGVFDEIPPEIVCKPLIEDEYVVFFSEEHPLAQKEDIYFADIRNMEIATLPSNGTLKIVDRIFSKMGCKPNVVFEGSQKLMMQCRNAILFSSKQMVYNSYIYNQKNTVQSEWLTQQAVLAKTIVDVDCGCTVSLCWKAGRTLPKMAQLFIDALDKSYLRYSDDAHYMQEPRFVFPVVNADIL